MKLSVNVSYLRKQRGTKQLRDILDCARIVRDAGFRYVDFTGNDYLFNDNWQETMEEIFRGFERIGITVDQTHAPYVYSGMDEDDYQEHMRRAFQMSHMAKAKHIVIHADKYIPDEDGFSFHHALETIYDFYAPYVDYAKKVGLGVAVENLFDHKGRSHYRFTAYVEEQQALIEKFNDPIVTACWDFGHGRVSYGDQHLDALKQLGTRVSCTHVHDNVLGMDLHQNPFLGDCNWEAVMAYLREIGYAGTFTFEMGYGILPDALLGKYMKLLYETGEYMRSL